MLFVWTGGGGDGSTFQFAACVALFLVQVLPRILPEVLNSEINTNENAIANAKSKKVADQNLDSIADANLNGNGNETNTLFVLLSFAMMLVIFFWMLRLCLIEEVPDDANDAPTPMRRPQRRLAQWKEKLRRRLQALSGGMIQWSNLKLAVFAGMAVSFFLSLLIHLDASSLSWMSQWIWVGAAVYSHYYAFGPGGDLAMARARQRLPETPAERASRHAKMQQIAKHIQRMPIEGFVPNEVVGKDAEDKEGETTTKIKDMLRRRGILQEELEMHEENHQVLWDHLQKQRKYSETCCICFEAFEAGEPLRILPQCHHELHLECLDKWAFTFASKSKRQLPPTCPLCKVPL